MALRTNAPTLLPFACALLLWMAPPFVMSERAWARDAAVLAVSWQPAFCETKPNKPECRTLTATRFDADHFALHGLWPQRRRKYCGNSPGVRQARRGGSWSRLPGIGLADDLKRPLLRAMPGAQSYLHRHEWWKHGTCYADNANSYYRDALALLDALNRSEVRHVFADRVGRNLSAREIREAFDTAFGPGAGRRVKIRCRRDGGRQLIVELQIGLVGNIPAEAKRGNLRRLIRASRPVRPDCPGGIVDPVGLQ